MLTLMVKPFHDSRRLDHCPMAESLGSTVKVQSGSANSHARKHKNSGPVQEVQIPEV